MTKQTYPAYRAMAFTETETNRVITLADTWYETERAARYHAEREAAAGWRAVVFLEAKDGRGVKESVLWESEPETIAWLDAHE